MSIDRGSEKDCLSHNFEKFSATEHSMAELIRDSQVANEAKFLIVNSSIRFERQRRDTENWKSFSNDVCT